MKSLSFDQMSQVEGGYTSPLCRNSLGLLVLALALGSPLLLIIALGGVYRFCGGGSGGGDSTFG